MIQANLINENCASLTGWTDADLANGVTSVNPAGQFQFATNVLGETPNQAGISKVVVSPPDLFTIEIKTYFNALGSSSSNDCVVLAYETGTWTFTARFATDGLLIAGLSGYVEVGTNLVKYAANAEWQTWRFQINKSLGEINSTAEVFLNNTSCGIVNCNTVVGDIDGRFRILSLGWGMSNLLSHIDSIKLGSGLGRFKGQGLFTFNG